MTGRPPQFELGILVCAGDTKSRQWLASLGPLDGRRCFEVGAGAGSIAAWLAAQVGPKGSVVAMDANLRFLRRLQHPQLQLVEGYLGQPNYVATGKATPSDIDAYAAFAQSPQCWATYYATVRMIAFKAAA